jgi:general secretion pathway protein L
MAATILSRTAAIWVPQRSIGERAFANEQVLVAVLPGAEPGKGPRWARFSLEALPAMKAVSLVFDARDVALVPAKLPPLSGARLIRALPNVVEDQLLQDAQSCAFALGPRVGDDQRLLAVIDRGWLEFVVGAFERRGIRVTAAWPAQLVLPVSAGSVSIACVHDGLAVRTGENEGFGWSATRDEEFRTEAIVSALEAAAHGGAKPESLSVFAEDTSWQPCAERAASRLGLRATVTGLVLPQAAPVDLLTARQGTSRQRWMASIDWLAWRLPAAVAAVAVLAFVVGANLHWGRLVAERAALRAEMEATFRRAFPQAQVVVDPMLQMQRQVADLRLRSGDSGPDDFLPLLARFSLALGPRANDALSSLEYREGRLRARFREAFLKGPSVRENLRAACQRQGLKLQFEGEGESLAIVSLTS